MCIRDSCDTELYMNDDIAKMFSNVYRVDFKMSSYTKFAKPLLKLIGFRYAPFELKKKCIFKPAAFDELVRVENTGENYSFTTSDYQFKGHLDTVGITTENSNPKFKFFHLDGAHVPFIYDKNMNIIDEHEGTFEMSVEAVMLEAADYVEKLRESGAVSYTHLSPMRKNVRIH